MIIGCELTEKEESTAGSIEDRSEVEDGKEELAREV